MEKNIEAFSRRTTCPDLLGISNHCDAEYSIECSSGRWWRLYMYCTVARNSERIWSPRFFRCRPTVRLLTRLSQEQESDARLINGPA